MPQEIEKGDRAKSLEAPICHSARDFNGRERLLTTTETAKLLRLIPILRLSDLRLPNRGARWT
jgi:hypothetical protein